jgi:vacuolar-type H+-ATPase subunit H
MLEQEKKPQTIEGETKEPQIEKESEALEESSEQTLTERMEEREKNLRHLKDEVDHRLDDLLSKWRNFPEAEASALLHGLENDLEGLNKNLKAVENELEK